MLTELYIRNLAVIEELRLKIGEQLTVLSGDEGVGKSIIVDALALILGERGSNNLIRSKEESALVEGIFEFEPGGAIGTLLREAGLEKECEGDNLILTRELQSQGRNIARVNGRAVSVSLLRELGKKLIDIHKQTENLAILEHQRQVDMLDEFGGLLELRDSLRKKTFELEEHIRQLGDITSKDAERMRDLLEYQVAEIERANVRSGEEEGLLAEERVLRQAEGIRVNCSAAYDKAYFDEESASTLLNQAIKALRYAATNDPALAEYLKALESACIEIEETARDLRHYTENLETSSERLETMEERIRLLRELKRKYGGSEEAVIHFATKAAQELENLKNLDERKESLEKGKQKLEQEASSLAQKLSDGRQEASLRLIAQVNSELAELGLPWARFDIGLKREEDPNGLTISGSKYLCGQNGIDDVEFLGATNPGTGLMPLAEIASGGETCRFMLALKSALQQVDRTPTLVFDEVDSGVGGRSARTIGRKLMALATDRQVIAITHLPQIACFGLRHYHVTKEIVCDRAFTRVELVDGESRVEELAAMLGSRTNPAMKQTARELMSEAANAARETWTERRKT